MLFCGYKRVDIEKDNIHGFTFFSSVEIPEERGFGIAFDKDFVSDTFSEVQEVLKVRVVEGADVIVERNKYGKIVGIIK